MMNTSDNERFKTTTIKVKEGCVKVNDATIDYQNENVAVVELDLGSKRAEFVADEGYILYFDKTQYTLYTNDTDKWTVVEFSDFIGWSLWSCHVNKYSARICFVKGIYDE